MTISARLLNNLLHEFEAPDPQDFGNLSLSEAEARHLICKGMAEFAANLQDQGVPTEGREALALAMCARLALENLVLNAEKLYRAGVAQTDTAALLRTLAAKR